MSPRWAPLLVVLALAGASWSVVAAQESTFVDRVDVELVNVEVWVTDREGHSVTGLSRRNFEVREDGERVEVSHFAEITPEVAFASGATPPATDAAPSDSDSPARGSASSPNHLVLLFDDASTASSSRARLVEDLRGFLRKETVPAERILLLSFGEQLQVQAPFGSTERQLQAALDRIARAAGRGTLEAGSKARTANRIQDHWIQASQAASLGDPCDLFLRRARAEVEAWAKTRRDQLLRSVDALRSAATMVSGVEGLKTLVYASDGFEVSPGADLVGFMDAICPGRPGELRRADFEGTLTDPLESLTRHANANRVTIYSLQASGLSPGVLGNASRPALEVRATQRLASELRIAERTGLELLAEETGGRALLDSNDLGGELEQVAEELGSYYSLAFVPNHDGDGADHQIEVRVLGDGLRVRYRRSYHDKSPQERLEEHLQSVLFLGDLANPLGVRLAAGALEPLEGGRFGLALHVLVPAERVTFLPASDRNVGRLQAQVALRDERNRSVVAAPKTYPVEKSEEDPGQRFAIRFDLELAPGSQVLGVAVRDLVSLETSLVGTTVNVPEPSPQN